MSTCEGGNFEGAAKRAIVKELSLVKEPAITGARMAQQRMNQHPSSFFASNNMQLNKD